MKEKKRQFLGKLFFVPRSLGTGGASGRGPDVVREGGIGGWEGGAEGGAICAPIADSHCCTAGTNTSL